MRPKKRIVLVFFPVLIVMVWFGSILHTVYASPPLFAIAVEHDIKDEKVEDGDIVSYLTNNKQDEDLELAKVTGDQKAFGVVVLKPQVLYRINRKYPVVREGYALVNVSDLSGPIVAGDYITSSEIPGKGQKAITLSGYMVGVALGSYDGKEGTNVQYKGKTYKVGKIPVTVGIGPASPVTIKAAGGLFGTLQALAKAFLFNLASSKSLDKWLRYILAALVAITTIYINFKTFGRNVTRGIEAIGRNPMAKVAIQSMIVVNIVLIGVVSIGGIILSLAILTL